MVTHDTFGGYQGYLFLVEFWIDDDSRRHACRAGLCKLVDLALRSAHLARLHFEVLFDNKLYFESHPVNLPPPSGFAINFHSTGSFVAWDQAWV